MFELGIYEEINRKNVWEKYSIILCWAFRGFLLCNLSPRTDFKLLYYM